MQCLVSFATQPIVANLTHEMETVELAAFFQAGWNGHVGRSRASLDFDDVETVQSFASWVDIEVLLRTLTPSIMLIQPALRHLHSFVNFFETGLGPRLNPSYFWGSIGCLLKLTAESEDSEMLEKVPRMIKSLAHKAEAFNTHCSDISSMGSPVKEACFDMQILFAEFFTSSIQCVHGTNDRYLAQSENPLRRIERRFASINQELGEAVARVEKLTISTSAKQLQPLNLNGVARCLMLPPLRISRCFDRVHVFADLDRILAPTVTSSFRSVALFGIGGVGKSIVASTYIDARYKENIYHVCLWAQGATPEALRQSFTDIALRLKLPDAQPHKHDDNLNLVQDWFQYAECSWIIVFDNVESAEVLMPYWPASSKGRAIITTRNDSLAFEPASEGLEVTSWDPTTGSEFLIWLLKRKIGRDLALENESALALSECLGGHALIISQMAGLIQRSKFSVTDFMVMYMKNPRTAHARDEVKAIWDMSFRSLDPDSQQLLGVMAFLMPDNIQCDIFSRDDAGKFPASLSFCTDTSRYLEAIGTLSTLGLIRRDIDTGAISIHRMVQTQFKYHMTPEQRFHCFSNAIALISDLFPTEDSKAGQMYEMWQACNAYAQHILSLRDCFVEERKLSNSFIASLEFCNLLSRSQRFFYETNAMDECEKTCSVNMMAAAQLSAGPQREDIKATIISHQAQMAESLGYSKKAVLLNMEGYKIRLAEEPMNARLLCFTAANLGYCSSAAGDNAAGLEWHNKALEWWGGLPDFPPNILANKARCLILLGDYTAAKELINVFMAQIRNTSYTNWAMIAQGYFLTGVFHKRQKEYEIAEQFFAEAQNAWLRGDQTRLHPFNGGCMYNMGVSCLNQGKVELAIKHLQDSLVVSDFHKKKRPAEHARNLFKLSEAVIQDEHHGGSTKAEELWNQAQRYLKERVPNAVDCSTDEAYDSLVSIIFR